MTARKIDRFDKVSLTRYAKNLFQVGDQSEAVRRAIRKEQSANRRYEYRDQRNQRSEN
jgi:hypothetical protein